MSETEELKSFPVSMIRSKSARFKGSLLFNPYGDRPLPPSLWYGIGIDLEEIDLGEDAPLPDVFGTKIETTLCLGGIDIPQRRWIDFGGPIGPVEDVGESSVYVSQRHNPIDVLSVSFTRVKGAQFQIDLDLNIAFEFEGSGFKDARCSVSTRAKYEGISFFVPRWSDPSSVRFPSEWRIPAEFNDATVTELFDRFADTSDYLLKRERDLFRLVPKRLK